MNFATIISFMGTKAFRYIGTGLIILLSLWFFYDKFETAITNNTTLRENNLKLQEQVNNLKTNIKTQQEKYKQELKAQEFNLKAKDKKEDLQKKVNSYKKKETQNEKNKGTANISPIPFSL